ncbi:MAG: NAD(P)-dependent alcohol dehydrogenase [Anaerolineales bacterium]|nr:NAD(P)-dependent alcohol dehydrogenase [Anaerolineales bacterium]
MKAIVATQYGSPDLLSLQEIDRPEPGPGEILIQVAATAANPLDWRRLRAEPILVRFGEGLFRPKFSVLGADVAGTVVAVGEQVSGWAPGDEVFGEVGSGGFAEYVCAKAETVVAKPAGLSFPQAAAIPVAGLTALQSLRDHGRLQAGQQVLINGASGGLGTFSVQIAKALGAEVTGVCSSRNVDLVRSLGADHVIDYTKADPTRTGRTYDLILDNVGNFPVGAYRRGLKPAGIGVSAGFKTLGHMLKVVLGGAWLSLTGKQKIGLMMARMNQPDLTYLGELAAAGQLKPVIDRCYPLAETPEALNYLETGRARGKVIIQVES